MFTLFFIIFDTAPPIDLFLQQQQPKSSTSPPRNSHSAKRRKKQSIISKHVSSSYEKPSQSSGSEVNGVAEVSKSTDCRVSKPVSSNGKKSAARIFENVIAKKAQLHIHVTSSIYPVACMSACPPRRF